MNEFELGPITELSRSMQRKLRALNVYNEKYWFIVCLLLDNLVVEHVIIIDKHRVGAPYEFMVKAILSGEEACLRAETNAYVMCICEPIKWVQAKHELEVKENLSNAGETWFRT